MTIWHLGNGEFNKIIFQIYYVPATFSSESLNQKIFVTQEMWANSATVSATINCNFISITTTRKERYG